MKYTTRTRHINYTELVRGRGPELSSTDSPVTLRKLNVTRPPDSRDLMSQTHSRRTQKEKRPKLKRHIASVVVVGDNGLPKDVTLKLLRL